MYSVVYLDNYSFLIHGYELNEVTTVILPIGHFFHNWDRMQKASERY